MRPDRLASVDASRFGRCSDRAHENASQDGKIIENRTAFLDRFQFQRFDCARSGEVLGFELARNVISPMPPNRVTMQGKHLGEAVQTRAGRSQSFERWRSGCSQTWHFIGRAPIERANQRRD